MKSLFKYVNWYLLAAVVLTLLPTVWVATRPLKPETASLEVMHAKRIAVYMKNHDCRRQKYITGVYQCKETIMSFQEISAHVWKESL